MQTHFLEKNKTKQKENFLVLFDTDQSLVYKCISDGPIKKKKWNVYIVWVVYMCYLTACFAPASKPRERENEVVTGSRVTHPLRLVIPNNSAKRQKNWKQGQTLIGEKRNDHWKSVLENVENSGRGCNRRETWFKKRKLNWKPGKPDNECPLTGS